MAEIMTKSPLSCLPTEEDPLRLKQNKLFQLKRIAKDREKWRSLMDDICSNGI